MPEISFVFDPEDERRLISTILQKGARLVADRQPLPIPEEISDFDAFVVKRRTDRLFFCVHDYYQQWPLSLKRINRGFYEGTFSVEQRIGGPAIDVLLSANYEKDGKRFVSDGSIGTYPSYENPNSGAMELPPATLTTFYRALIKQIKVDCAVIKGNSGRKWLIGPNTLRRLKTEELHFQIVGLPIDWNMI